MTEKSKSKERPIYLDYHSTTPVDIRVAEKVMYYMTTAFGNPSSVTHSYSDEAEEAITQARNDIAELINASPKEIIFTSGATESINLAMFGLIKDCSKKYKIAVSPLEHKAILDTCKNLSKKNLSETIYLKVDHKGRIDLEDLEQKCQEGIDLVCIMAANNEIGNIYPVNKIGEITDKYNVPFLCDATQAVGRIPINFEESKITYLTLSAHKMYGPKGAGALVIRKGHSLNPMLCGGGQQKGIRPGTLNVSGIVGLGESCRLRNIEMMEDEKEIKIKRDDLLNFLQKNIPELIVNGDIDNKLSGNLSISIPNISNSDVINKVRDKIAISTGSACSSGFEGASHVLTALGLSSSIIGGTLRIAIGKYTSNNDIAQAKNILLDSIKYLQSKSLVNSK
ncbi:MAG: cysteine desulfurase [Candidatus Sericytochromatia bacterium]|nr:cysteine desulfurase [Candidatus Sericytochromatia bacterium]